MTTSILTINFRMLFKVYGKVGYIYIQDTERQLSVFITLDKVAKSFNNRIKEA